jgi:cbb3-type cytochrome oxidase subunit 3
MSGNLIAIIVILVLLLVLAGIIYYAYCNIRKKLRDTSRMLFGTDSMIEGMKQREKEVEMTPKSVSSATNLYMPSIMRDFPEFHYDEMKSRAENVLTSYLQSITKQNPALLSEGTRELKEQLRLRLEMLQNQSQKESFENIHIHRTEIHQYRKQRGRQSIVLQTAVEYFHALKENGKVIGGSEEHKEQAKYNVELVYIQDQDMYVGIQNSNLKWEIWKLTGYGDWLEKEIRIFIRVVTGL